MRKTGFRLAGAAALTALVAACGGQGEKAGEETPDASADEAQMQEPGAPGAAISDEEARAAAEKAAADFAAKAAENLAASTKFLEENEAGEGILVTESGLQYRILSEGPKDGDTPGPEDIVDVHYVGTLIDGVEFDSSRARGAAARFQASNVIPGWVEGLQLMSEGDNYRFFVPPGLAYGETGTPGGPIGPNQALIFDVELLKVSSAEKNAAAAETFLTENAKKDGVKSTESGLQYKVLSEGKADGKSPTDANIVSVHYEGRLLDGEIFDSSYERGAPAEFPLGRVIPGWTEGVQLMSEGAKYQFYIKPELAYGPMGTPGGPIGPNELLVFDVELLEVKE